MTTLAASAWRVRHAGSPRTIDGLDPQQIAEGLQDGLWEPTDEVRGPDEMEWVAIEEHPLFAEAAADIESPPAGGHGDETHLDMNPLIDVCLVLLVFFILTTSYALLQKRLDAPEPSNQDPDKVLPVKAEDVQRQMIVTMVRLENGEPVIRVEGGRVTMENLATELRKRKVQTLKTILLLDVDGEVPHGTVVKVQHAAQQAGMEKVALAVPKAK
jgi:biopolymer transport protein ExbD